MKLLFDKNGEMILWSEGESVTISVNGSKYTIDGQDLDFFSEFISANMRRIEREKDRKTPLKQKLKKIWTSTD
jgi:hypothetical protein